MRLIDAEHLKRWIMLRWESGISVGYDDVKTNEILEQIDRELTINLEPRKKGKWDFMGWQMFQCSECKHMFTQDFLEGWKEYTYESHFPPFCPNCGAYMREGEEE